MDWTTLLRSQQADFIQRLKYSFLLRCEIQSQHSELTVISGKRLKQLRDFCWHMAEKYKQTSPVRDVFINNLKGKLGEEVVKARLAEFVTKVDYEKRLGGDGKVDFTLTCDPFVGIQVKACCGSIDKARWSISQEEVEKNAALVCILIQEEVNEAQTEYNLVTAGFIPTKMIEVINAKASFGINELLYCGGLRSYLESWKFSKPDYISLGKNCYEKGDYQGAIANYDQALQLNPNLAEVYYNRAFARYHKVAKEAAITDFTEAIKINSNHADAYFYRGCVWYDVGEKLRAVDDFEKAEALYRKQGKQAGYQKARDKVDTLIFIEQVFE